MFGFSLQKKKTAHSLDCVYESVILYEQRTANSQQLSTQLALEIPQTMVLLLPEPKDIKYLAHLTSTCCSSILIFYAVFQSEIEGKTLKFVFLYFQKRLKDQTLVHLGKQPEVTALIRC